MKLTRLAATAIASMAIALAGCSDQILDVTPLDQISDETVFADPNVAQTFIYDIYRGIGHGAYGTTLWSLTDDGHNTRFGGASLHMASNITSSSLGAMGDNARFGHYGWQPLYSRIRQANIFLAGIDSTSFPQATKDRMKGEVHFLRAYFYHNLLRIYGGVPIITKVYGLTDDFQAARNTFAETVEMIVADADTAAMLLPLGVAAAEEGRATKGAALALKSRVLMYAASDLANLNPRDWPELGYPRGGDRAARWRRARDAAKAVMDLGKYSLYKATPAASENVADNYNGIWFSKTNGEIILARYFLARRGTTDQPNVGVYDGPNGYHNWGSNTPTQNLVDAYRMADGSKFDWNNPAHAAAPYANRDPRFYASIHYDGAKWVARPSDTAPLEPQGIIQTFSRVTLPDGSFLPGLDSRSGPVESWNGTYSGYYKRKAIDPAVNHQFVQQEVPWIFFRYAEVLLDYAEASMELGDEATARETINQIRRRVNMPPFAAALTGAALRDEYRNERRIELAFEEQRYFDARRWMIAPTVFGENPRGVDITVKATNPFDRATYRDYSYRIISVDTRRWDDKMYFNPIPRDEINRNTLLKQNPGF